MTEQLFQYAIIYTPTEEGAKSEIIKDVTSIIASDEKSILMLASRDIPEKYLDKLDQVNILVRPF